MAQQPEQSTRIRSTSAGASELPQHENKRPRLDTDAVTDVQQKDSKSELSAFKTNLVAAKHRKTEGSAKTPEATITAVEAQANVVSPTSKVTINTRPLSAQSSNIDGGSVINSIEADVTATTSKGGSPVIINVSDIESADAAAGEPNAPISIPSSPSEVVIEICPPEDVDDSPGSSQWRRVDDSFSQPRPFSLWGTFPYSTDGTRTGVLKTTLELAEILEKVSGPNFKEVLTCMTTWLKTIPVSSYLFDTRSTSEDLELISRLTIVTTSFFKRRTSLPEEVTEIDLLSFIKAFAATSMSVIKSDIARLNDLQDFKQLNSKPPILSVDFIRLLGNAVMPDPVLHLHKAIERSLHISPRDFAPQVCAAVFQEKPDEVLEIISSLFDTIVLKVPVTSNYRATIPTMVSAYRNLLNAVHHFTVIRDDRMADAIRKTVLRFAKSADAAIRQAIGKQHPWLSIDNASPYLDTFTRLASASVGILPDLIAFYTDAACIAKYIAPDAVLREYASEIYKLALLRDFVQCGRMELRVSGIDAMAVLLVECWKHTLQGLDPQRKEGLVALVNDFVRQNKVIEFLFGVDCPSQVVQRSGNVIGFVCISNHWQTSDNDTAWNAILKSEDHRSRAAILDVLAANFEHMPVNALLHNYQKLHELPFEKYDNLTHSFMMRLLEKSLFKSNHEKRIDGAVDMAVLKLCLHLLQEAFVPSRCATDTMDLVRENVFQWLVSDRPNEIVTRAFLHLGSGKDDLFAELIKHVQQHTERSTGSVLGIIALLNSLDDSEFAKIVLTTDYFSTLLDDLVYAAGNQGLDPKAVQIIYNEKLLGLSQLIMTIPDKVDRQHAESLWRSVLSSNDSALRSIAWKTLAEIYVKLQSSNNFLDLIAQTFLPNLSPTLYDQHVLAFCEASTSFDISHRLTHNYGIDASIHIPAMERIWTIMLGASNKIVAERASDYIVKMYLRNPVITGKSHGAVYQTYAAIVDRCISTVLRCADSSGEQLRTRAAQCQVELQANTLEIDPVTQLHRTLSLLRKLLNGLKNRPRLKASASDALSGVLQGFERKGNPIELDLRVFNHPEVSDNRVPWTVGDENTTHEIWQFLTELTGWSQIMLIKGGKRPPFEDDQTAIKYLKLNPGDLQVHKAKDASIVGPGRVARASSPVDDALTHHFGGLYALLEHKEEVAKPVYDFLVLFPSQINVVAEVKNAGLDSLELLPVDKPYKLRFYASSLRSCVEEESFSPNPDTSFLTYAVNTLVATLGHLHSISSQILRLEILADLVEVLLLALRARVSELTSATYFPDTAGLVTNTLALWTEVQVQSQTFDKGAVPNMDHQFLDLLIEASLHNEQIWQLLPNDKRFRDLVSNAVLLNEDINVREKTTNVVLRLAGVSVAKSAAKVADIRSPQGRFDNERIETCLQYLWEVCFARLLPQLSDRPFTSQQAVEVCMAVFELVSKSLAADALTAIYTDLRQMLLAQHNPVQKIYCSNEMIPLNLARMLGRTVQLLGEAGVTPAESAKLIRDLCTQFLFPPLSNGPEISLKEQSMPLLDGEARAAIYGLVLQLCKTSEDLSAVADELEDGAMDDKAFSLVTANERKALRTDQGYAGLRNMSNTCYLNSLFTQLFMNVKFREFVLGVNVVDSRKQRTVVELGQLFARLQSSYEKFVSPEDTIETITQYTGEQIDVTVQMDVDEFYNLLFDRLESQIVDEDSKRVFKSFYGGELVQQIKSKECEHVSERTEPFNAVQVDIRGKSGLAEGLAAYVEGEVLQGENKYSCTGCGKHVDAVKRACLKEIPDNLIFNLKRFDYDIMTGMRCKVNDGFSFPESIDMMPYTMQALSQEGTTFPPDIFELVGVIIHSGTAETGHYYSYIRQRPSPRESTQSWIQFNDTDVSQFDFAQLRDQAFGGSDTGFSGYLKFYNGYMLFYQRKSSIESCEHDYPFFTTQGTTTVSLPAEIESTIALENELSFRRYVVQDPAHAKFLRQVLERLHEDGEISHAHGLKEKVINVVLDAIHTVVSRLKDAAELDGILTVLNSLVDACPRCAIAVLKWFHVKETVVATILQAFYTQGRKGFVVLLYHSYAALTPLRETQKLTDGRIVDKRLLTNLLNGNIKQITNNWSEVQKYPRGWEQVFSLFSRIAKLGETDAVVLVELDVLTKCLEIVWVHYEWNRKTTPHYLRKHYATYINAREKNRGFNHTVVMETFADLLPYVNLEWDVAGNSHTALDPSEDEQRLFGLTSEASFDWLRRIVAGGSNDAAADRVIKEVCKYTTLHDRAAHAIFDGLEQSRYHNVAARFLRACMIFAENCTTRKLVVQAIKKCLLSVNDSEGHYSEQYLGVVEFLVNSERLPTLDQGQIRNLVLIQLAQWAPALLMAPNDSDDVRNKALNLVGRVLFRLVDNVDVATVQADGVFMGYINDLVDACVTYASKHFLETQGRGQEHRSQLSSGQSAQIIDVMRDCMKFMPRETANDDAVISQIEDVIDRLEQLESMVETYEMYAQEDASSEPMSDLESFSST